MPTEYKEIKYGCEFKCGQKHTKHRKLMEAHELRCWKNPVNKSCPSCKHSIYRYDPNDFNAEDPACSYVGVGWERDCKIGKFSEDDYEKGVMYFGEEERSDQVKFIKPKQDCSWWELK
jgi:hypothetical protein